MAIRPVGQHGTGFFCIGKTLYDANGNEFRIRGINDIGFWRGGIDLTTNLLPSYRQAKINAIRIPFDSFSADGIPRATRVQAFIDNKIIPIPVAFSPFGGGDATSGNETPANLASATDGWINTEGVWVRAKERYLILNIANEWGPISSAWRDSYIAQIARLRTANINCTLMVDAGGSGEGSEDIENFAQAIFDADPEHNVVFSIHTYAAFWTETPPESWQYGLNAKMAIYGAMTVPVVAGEFSSPEYAATQGWPGTLDPAHVIAQAEANALGWLGWQWYNDSPENMINDAGGGNNPLVYTGSSSQLSTFGVKVIKNGTEPLALQASIFGGGMAINSSIPTPTMAATLVTVATSTLTVSSTLTAPTMAAAMATSAAANDMLITTSLPVPTMAATLGAPSDLVVSTSLPVPTMVANILVPTIFTVTATLPSLIAVFAIGAVQLGSVSHRNKWPLIVTLTEQETFRKLLGHE